MKKIIVAIFVLISMAGCHKSNSKTTSNNTGTTVNGGSATWTLGSSSYSSSGSNIGQTTNNLSAVDPSTPASDFVISIGQFPTATDTFDMPAAGNPYRAMGLLVTVGTASYNEVKTEHIRIPVIVDNGKISITIPSILVYNTATNDTTRFSGTISQ